MLPLIFFASVRFTDSIPYFFGSVRCSDMYCFATCRSLGWNEHKINGKATARTENRLPPPARPHPDRTCLDQGPARAGLPSMNMKNMGISLQHFLSRLTRCAAPFGPIQLHVRFQDLRKHDFFRVRTGGHYRALVVLRLIAQRHIYIYIYIYIWVYIRSGSWRFCTKREREREREREGSASHTPAASQRWQCVQGGWY